jgi:hypothetical protein
MLTCSLLACRARVCRGLVPGVSFQKMPRATGRSHARDKDAYKRGWAGPSPTPGALAHGGPAVIRCLVHPAEVAILDRFRSQRRCLRAGGLRAPEVTLHEEKISSLRLRR